MEPRKALALWLSLCSALVAPSLEAQESTGTLEVEARGAEGHLPADARVRVERRGDPPVSRSAGLDGDGRATLEDLPPGICTVTVTATDHESVTLAAVELMAGAARGLSVTLPYQPPPA